MSPDLTPKQQASEAIRQAETILIMTGQRPTIDQAAATLALTAVLRKYGKKVTAIVSDPLPLQVGFLDTSLVDRALGGLRDFIITVDLSRAEADALRYERAGDKLNVFLTPGRGGFAPRDVSFGYGQYHYDLAIALGVPTRARLDRIYAENPTLFANLPIINLDYHRTNENYGAINLIEPSASSLSEMLVALAESLQNGIVDESIATALLTGLMASTDRFTAGHTTAKSLTVAAQLMAAGARQPVIVRHLFRDSRAAQTQERREQERTATSNQPVNRQPVQTATPVPSQTDSPDPAPESAPTPAPAPTEAEPTQETPAVTLPLAAEPTDEPIIDPAHIEALAPLPEGQIPMADFASAAKLLERADEPTNS